MYGLQTSLHNVDPVSIIILGVFFEISYRDDMKGDREEHTISENNKFLKYCTSNLFHFESLPPFEFPKGKTIKQ